MKTLSKLPVALLALSLAVIPLLTLPTPAQGIPVGLACPFFGGTCEALPQLSGFTYAFQASGNAFISAPSPPTSPAALVSCLRLFPTDGRVSVTITAPDGQQATISVRVCPGFDGDGPVFPF